MVSRYSIRTLAGVLLAGGVLAGSLLGATGAQAATASGYQAAAPNYQALSTQSGYWGPVEGQVVAPEPLNVRSGPGLDYWANGTIDPGSVVWLGCKVEGTDIGGNDIWYRLADGSGWVTGYYVYHDDYVPWCDA